MAKTQTSTTERQNASKRKKQAKQEAKAMLKVEQAKKDVQKAEQKAAKAQTKLEARRTRLHDLEQNLDQARAPQQSEMPQESQLPLLTPESAQNNGANQADRELPFVNTPVLDIPQPASQANTTASSGSTTDDTAASGAATTGISTPAFDDTPGMPATDAAVASSETAATPATDSTSSAPQVDTGAIAAFHSASIEPSEGREDISSADAASSNDGDQPLTEAESDTTTEPTSAWGASSNAASSNDGDQPLTEAESDTTTEPTNAESETPEDTTDSTAPATSEGS